MNLLGICAFCVASLILSGGEIQGAEIVSQVSELKGFFRNGQTFLTWSQIPSEKVQYRIYRSTEPITDINQLSSKLLVTTVKDYTGFNWLSSINRRNLQTAVQTGKRYTIPRRVNYIIEEGKDPIPDATGLFVYTAKETQLEYYAVTAVVDGKENKSVVVGRNSLSGGIMEKVEPVMPIKQNRQDYVHWTDNVGTRFYPAMSSQPSVPYIFRVKVPRGDGPFCLKVVLHGGGGQFNSLDLNREEQALPLAEVADVTASFDSPSISAQTSQLDIDGLDMDTLIPGGWWGYSNTWGTSSNEKGEVVDYHIRRVIWGLEWVQKNFEIDLDRVALEGGSMGGIGAMMVGLRYPQYFSVIGANIAPLMENKEGYFNPYKYVETHPGTEFPFIVLYAGRTDLAVGFKDKPEFLRLTQKTKIGSQLTWSGGGHGAGNFDKDLPTSHTLPQPDLRSFRRNQSFPALANCTANDDYGTVDLAVPKARRPAYDALGVGDLVGTINGQVNWDRASIVDEADHYEITLMLETWSTKDLATADITPRRVQNFKPVKGTSVECKVTDLNSGAELLSKTVEPDDYGYVTVTTVPLKKTATRLAMKVINNIQIAMPVQIDK